MGVDIHTFIVNKDDGSIIKKDLYEGRNSEWFQDLQGRGYKFEYDELPTYIGIPEVITDGEIKEDYDTDFLFGFNYITIKDFCDWFVKYRPDKDAGWITTYDKWRVENKGYYPEDNLKYYLDKDDRIEDMHFVEVVDKYDPSAYIYNQIKDLNDEDYFVYYFDC